MPRWRYLRWMFLAQAIRLSRKARAWGPPVLMCWIFWATVTSMPDRGTGTSSQAFSKYLHSIKD